MALPQGFVSMIQSYGQPQYMRLLEALESSSPEVSVRLNPAKYPAGHTAGLDPVPWCPGGFYLAERPTFTFDPLMHQGAYYVQDASSMFIAHVAGTLAAGSPVRWLDACAAPGGKTTAVASALPAGSVVVANEFVRQRADILRENIAKWGYPDVAVVSCDTSAFTPCTALFNIISADVPCSGEGMMRKDVKAVEQWSEALVAQCVERQRTILANLWPALAPGGYLIYSTCTFNRAENELMLSWLCSEFGAEPVAIPVDGSWGIMPGIDTTMPCYRFTPGIIRGEGLFMAVVRKPDADAPVTKVKSSGPRKGHKADKATAPVASWLLPEAEVELRVNGDNVEAISTTRLAAALPPALRPRAVIARAKGRDYLPTQQLALSLMLNRDTWPAHEVDRATALTFLRAEALRLPDSAPRGLLLLTYAGLPLGFVKNIGSRANNLYPDEWRIRSTIPATLPPLPLP